MDIVHLGVSLYGVFCEFDIDCFYGVCYVLFSVGGIVFCTKLCDCGLGLVC